MKKLPNFTLLLTTIFIGLFTNSSYACHLCESKKPRTAPTYTSSMICNPYDESSTPRPPRDSYTAYMKCDSCEEVATRNICNSCASATSYKADAAPKPVVTESDYDAPHMEGFYLGLNAGYGLGDIKGTITPLTAIALPYGTHIGTNGKAYGLHAGYQKQIGTTGLIGLELGGGKNGMKGSATNFPTTISFKGSSSYSAAIRTGLLMNYWLASIKFGIEETKFKASVTDSFNPSSNVNLSGKKRKRGNVFGVGFETMLSEHMLFGGEWTLTSYDKISGSSLNGASYNFKPKVNYFKLRMGYLF